MKPKKNESIINLKLYRSVTLLILILTIVNVVVKFTTKEVNYYVYENQEKKSFTKIWSEATKLEQDIAFEYISIPRNIYISKMEFRIDDRDMENYIHHVYLYTDYDYYDWCNYYEGTIPAVDGFYNIDHDITIQYDIQNEALVVKNLRLLNYIQCNGEKIYTKAYLFKMKIGIAISILFSVAAWFFENIRDAIKDRRFRKKFNRSRQNKIS